MDITLAEPDFRARSPWSMRSTTKSVRISPAQGPIRGHYIVPGSKSFTNRALLLAGMAAGSSTLHGILKSDDSYWCIEVLKSLGATITVEGDDAHIVGVSGKWQDAAAPLYIGAAGTTARFLPGLLAASTSGASYTIEGSQSLSVRPIGPLVDALRTLGAKIEYLGNHGFLPIRVVGQGLSGGHVSIEGNVSSQFISGLLMASAHAQSTVTVHITSPVVQHAYIHITLDLMRRFGATVEATPNLDTITVQPSPYQAQTVVLEADASTAGYFLALAAVTEGDVTIDNLGYATNQPDIRLLDVLERMGCTVERQDSYVRCVGPHQLKGGMTISMKEMSDQALTLAAIAPFADGEVTITDVAHIRHHESDRIRAAYEALNRVGVEVAELTDGLRIRPGQPKPAAIPTHDDHRVAMSFAVLGAKVEGMEILDPGCVSKTCPEFFRYLEGTGVDVEFRDV